ncbi:copia protein, partial [Trifolium medium]|nr:copia protein [Trifolium medium]
HWVAVKRILRYLKGTGHHGFLLSLASPSTIPALKAFCDADWASDPDAGATPLELPFILVLTLSLGGPRSNLSLLDQAQKLNIGALNMS